MKFKFNKNLDYQIEAISSIVDIFDSGENNFGEDKKYFLRLQGPTVANELEIDSARILKNIQIIQEQNEIEVVQELGSLDFSIEMETGTGKTYVYLRTIMELNRKYGLKKFIILVPSVAIREGVLKTIQQTKIHFRELYGNGFGYFAYDSKKLSRVREFAQGIDVQIMIMTIQSFNKDANIMRQTPDAFFGESPLGLVAQTKPVVIMDEPQNMESELSKSAIKDLQALFRLRYSATHKEKYNLMYQLTPVDAYRNGLVKKIEVFGVHEDDPNAFIFSLKSISAKVGELPRAIVSLEVKNADSEFIIKDIRLKHADDLFRKTNNQKYSGLIINDIDARYNRIELSNGEFYQLGESAGLNKEQIFRTQIRETIKEHIGKQNDLGMNIKVLSLFFIDKVDNYIKENGLIRSIFLEEFNKLKRSSDYFMHLRADSVHNGYFASKKERGEVVYKDTTGKTAMDKDAYDLIMRDKERLLSFEEPVSFIFSHSALREGWDNPNIFQICTLNETVSSAKKRQEIGRGLRLAVNSQGDRIHDEKINVLTVIANESYQSFVSRLQTEYTDAGYSESPEMENRRRQVNVAFRKNLPAESEDFQILWNKIRKKTTYNIELHMTELIDQAVESINRLDINNLVVRVDRVIVDFDGSGKIKTIHEISGAGEKLETNIVITNIVDRIASETGITKRTVADILLKVSNLNILFENSEEYVRSAIVIIKSLLNELVINNGLKYLPTNNFWEIDIFDDFKSYVNKTIKSEKAAYERIEFDSMGEQVFAESLEKSRNVKLFTKLPRRFVIDTPLGEYTPDWAIVVATDTGDRLYLVRETKFLNDIRNLRPSEQQKILCGTKHFEAINVDYKVVIGRNLEDLM